VVALLAALPLLAPSPALGVGNVTDSLRGTGDLDARTGSVAPTATQKNIASNLGAAVQWNRFGTPASLIKYGGYLATGLSGSAVQAARSWLSSKAALFKLTSTDVSNLEVLNDSVMAGGAGHAVVFRQRFGNLPAAQDGLITVGIKAGKIAYVSSSSAGHQTAPASATLTAKNAWLKAAQSIDNTVTAGDIAAGSRQDDGWTVFSVAGYKTPALQFKPSVERMDQRARLVALPTYTQGVKAAYEVNVVNLQDGKRPVAYTFFVDARTGAVLFRQNAVDEAMALQPSTGFFQGTTSGACGPLHAIPVGADAQRIDVAATADIPADDIVLKLIKPDQTTVAASSDTATSPEAVDYQLAPSDPRGVDWYAQVCEFEPVPDFGYTGFYAVSDVATPAAFPFPPEWNFFTANPALPDGPLGPPFNYPETDNRTHSCWTDTGAQPGCTLDLTPNNGDTNLASRAPWDHNVQTNLPSFTSLGNNTNTAESWLAALTPGPLSQRPADLDRTYGFEEPADPQSATGALEGWTNAWNRLRCNPVTPFTPAENNNDVLAAVTTLNAGHNRFHDYSYHLGFTEVNSNMQVNNFGTTAPGPFPFGREDDPEIGNVQNGALLPAALGLTRDNANQITLQDGIPGVTNQFLFQPIAGAFYAPCADGDTDASVYGHEYTHAISNRMVGGPDAGLTGYQAGSMGESWSDQVALEYLHAYNFLPTSAGENTWALGIYATGNKQVGIRDYPLNDNPLNYSDLGFDKTGPEVHADGEVWNAVNYDIRQALVQKYNANFPASNAALQKRCADGNLPADKCPGNRRWIQIMFDAFLLQPGGTDMLIARDAYLAADQMRFNGANQATLWHAFARRGFGACSTNPSDPCNATRSAQTNGSEDDQPQPSFESPLEGEKAVTFVAKSSATGQAINAKIYVGRYEARVTPIADTNSNSTLSSTARFVPGTYDILAQADGFGLRRFRLAASSTGAANLAFFMTPNTASLTNGATASGDGSDFNALIDDTEGTTWDAIMPTNVDESKPQVTVNLAGTTAQMVRSVRVSAMLTPDDPRFTALRKFRIDACNAAAPVNANCTNTSSFQTIFTSADNAFNSVAPRPVAPDLLIKSFDVADTAATHIRLVVLHNQCTGAPDYQGEQDSDPTNPTDCDNDEPFDVLNLSTAGTEVHVAELETLGTGVDGAEPPPPSGPKDPVVTVTKSGPLTAATGTQFSYTLSYENLGPNGASTAKLVDTLPDGVSFVSASNSGTFNSTTRKVTWNLGTVAAGAKGSRTVTVKVNSTTPSGTLLLNQVEFNAPLTVSTPGAFLTLVQ
jgi:extracellular elastinolytic metalloproteinase